MKKMLITVMVQTTIEYKNKADYERKRDGFIDKLEAVEAEGAVLVEVDQEDEQ